jgi:hypothetical protein
MHSPFTTQTNSSVQAVLSAINNKKITKHWRNYFEVVVWLAPSFHWSLLGVQIRNLAKEVKYL